MLSFKNYYVKFLSEARVPYKKSRLIRKRIKKETKNKKEWNDIRFGFDIEFGPYLNPNEFSYGEIDFHKNRNIIMEVIKSKEGVWDLLWEDWIASENAPTLEEALDMWEDENPAPERDDFENEDDYDDEYSVWADKRDDFEYQKRIEIDEWEPSTSMETWMVDKWHQYLDIDALNQIHREAVEMGNMPEFVDNIVSLLKDELDFYRRNNILNRVDIDDGTDAEVTTELLTRENLYDLIDMLNDLATMGLKMDTSKSCHIHISHPKEKSLLYFLALFTVIDEEGIDNDIKRDMNSIQRFSAWNDDVIANKILPTLFHIKDKKKLFFGAYELKYDVNPRQLAAFDVVDYNKNTKSFTLNKHQMEILLDITVRDTRYQGVNLSNRDHIEFRYPSSEALEEPTDVIRLFDYFSLINIIAAKRKRVTFSESNKNYKHEWKDKECKKIQITEENPDKFIIKYM